MEKWHFLLKLIAFKLARMCLLGFILINSKIIYKSSILICLTNLRIPVGREVCTGGGVLKPNSCSVNY